jgi:hypothetical protein
LKRSSCGAVIPNPRAFCGVRDLLFAFTAWRQKRLGTCAFLFVGALSFTALATTPTSNLMPVSRGNLCVTEGAISELPGARLDVSVPKMRAYLNAPTPPIVEAQDACSLVYAMWRIEPESRLVVSVKSNPGEHTSAAHVPSSSHAKCSSPM